MHKSQKSNARGRILLSVICCLLSIFSISGICFSQEPPVPWKIELELTSPKGGEYLTGNIEVKYKFENTDKDAINTVKIYLSADGGTTYPYSLSEEVKPVSAGTFSYILNTRNYPDGTNYKIKIEIIDNGTPPLTATKESGQFIIDNSAPTKPTVSDEGAYTSDPTKLSASWVSHENASKVIEYSYAIGKTSGSTDIVNWTSAGNQTSITHTGLSLENNQIYYISVKAKNSAGLISEVGVSDGITYVASVITDTKLTFNPPSLTLTKEEAKEGKKVECSFVVSGDSNITLQSEKTVYTLPNREQHLPEVVLSPQVVLHPGTTTLPWDIVLDDIVINEALGGNVTGDLKVKKSYNAQDNQGRQFEISQTLNITINATPQLQIHKVQEITVDLPTNTFVQNQENIGTIKIMSSGSGGKIIGNIYINDIPYKQFTLSAAAGEQTLSFPTPPLPTENPGLYTLYIQTVAPNLLSSQPVMYNVVKTEAIESEIKEIGVKTSILHPTEVSSLVEEEVLFLTGNGILEKTPFGIGEVECSFKNIKIRRKDSKIIDGVVEVHNPVTAELPLLGKVEIKKDEVQEEPVLKLDKESALIKGIGIIDIPLFKTKKEGVLSDEGCKTMISISSVYDNKNKETLFNISNTNRDGEKIPVSCGGELAGFGIGFTQDDGVVVNIVDSPDGMSVKSAEIDATITSIPLLKKIDKATGTLTDRDCELMVDIKFKYEDGVYKARFSTEESKLNIPPDCGIYFGEEDKGGLQVELKIK